MLKHTLKYGDWEITQMYADIFVYQHEEFTGDTDIRAGSSDSLKNVIDEINEIETELA